MWPVPEIHLFLPEHLHASEDTVFLLIRCSLCRWSVWFSASGVSLQELTRAVEEHRSCPARGQTEPMHARNRPKRR
jgi:hypothetical protein